MDQALVIQYLRRWNAAEADRLADSVEACEFPPSQDLMIALSKAKDKMPISPVLDENWAVILLLLGNSPDIQARRLHLGTQRIPGVLLFLDEMAERTLVMTILESLVVGLRSEQLPEATSSAFQTFLEQSSPSVVIQKASTMADLLKAVLAGRTVLLVDGLPVGLEFTTDGPTARKPSEPDGEPVVRGPKDGFTEVASVNLSLIRRRLRDDRLRVEELRVGTRSHTRVLLVYMLEVSLPELVDEVRQRISRIKIDAVLESGYIEEMIEDQPFSLFPQVKASERPDVVVGGILEGKVAIITDGTPHVMLVPATFAAEMQAAEDYYHRWPVSSFMRLLRYGFMFIAFLGPGIYIAVTTYHNELIPTTLLLSLIAAREGVPFPSMLEAFFMELTLEALREAGVRLPKTVGQAISIVGALVIGESAVRAGLVSPVMVIVVSLTAIASFLIPLYTMSLAIRVLRFAMMVLGGFFGLFGIAVGLMLVLIHLISLRSFGIPYLSPMIPATAADLKDVFIRVPWWAMRRRPLFMPMEDHQRGQESANRPRIPGLRR